jgi:hypothetical protein
VESGSPTRTCGNAVDVARFAAYLAFLLVLFCSEVVVARWRAAMRDDLYDVRDALVDMSG